MSRRKEWAPLTDEQRQFATEHHNLIYSFLYQRGLDIEEWYGVAAEGFIKAIIANGSKKGEFSTLAYLRMGTAISNERKSQRRLRRSAFKASIEEMLEFGADPYAEDDNTSMYVCDFFQHLSNREQIVCKLTLNGYTKREIAALSGISYGAVKWDWFNIRQKFKKAIAE